VRRGDIVRGGVRLDPRRAVRAQGIKCCGVSLIEAAAAPIHQRGGRCGVVGIECGGLNAAASTWARGWRCSGSTLAVGAEGVIAAASPLAHGGVD